MRCRTARSLLVVSPLVALLLASCGGSDGSDSDSGSKQGDYPGAALGLAPVAPGFVRYVTPPLTVQPGQDVMWNDWVAPPIDADMDVVAVTGKQSKGGHHAILYGTSEQQPIGTSREWQDRDQLTTQTVGSVGGEGESSSALPPGVVFRIKKGSALMIQSHYLNTTKGPLQGVSVIDVKLAPADPAAKVAGRFVNTSLEISLAPNADTTQQVTCKVAKGLNLLAYANHMHSLGTSVSTELTRPDGTTKLLKVDERWNYSWAFAPNYTKLPIEAPEIIPAGSTITTTCHWTNSNAAAVKFPSEMCVFVGFFVGDSDVSCIDSVSL